MEMKWVKTKMWTFCEAKQTTMMWRGSLWVFLKSHTHGTTSHQFHRLRRLSRVLRLESSVPVLDEVPVEDLLSRRLLLLLRFLSRRDRTDLALSLGGDTGWTTAGWMCTRVATLWWKWIKIICIQLLTKRTFCILLHPQAPKWGAAVAIVASSIRWAEIAAAAPEWAVVAVVAMRQSSILALLGPSLLVGSDDPSLGKVLLLVRRRQIRLTLAQVVDRLAAADQSFLQFAKLYLINAKNWVS